MANPIGEGEAPDDSTDNAKQEFRRLRRQPLPNPRTDASVSVIRSSFFEDLREEMARFWGQRPMIPRPTFRLAEGIWAPRADVFEKKGNMHIKVELPGVNKDAVKLEMDNGDLVIQAERKAEEEVREEDYYRMERTYGSFYRRLPIPFEVKPEQIKASYNDGVLDVEIPDAGEDDSGAGEDHRSLRRPRPATRWRPAGQRPGARVLPSVRASGHFLTHSRGNEEYEGRVEHCSAWSWGIDPAIT